MLNAFLSRVLGTPDSPTADLYFLNACGDFLRRGVRRIAPTVFASARTCLVVRHDMRMGWTPASHRLVYLLDDDIAAGLGDESLPSLYRQKLRMVEAAAMRRLASRAARLVVSGPAVAGALGRPEAAEIMPYWSDPFADLDHFEPLLAGEGAIDIAFLGSTVHRADLDFVQPAVEAALARNPRLRFHVPARHRLCAALDAHPRVLRIPGEGWTEYRRELRMRRFHMALYPLLDTPFNRARSVNKLIEHAMVGAAPLYSEGWPEGRRVSLGINGIRLANRQRDWLDAIEGLARDPGRMLGLAAGAQALGRRLNDPAPQRRLWGEEFALPEAACA